MEQNLEWVEDSSNASDDYTRNFFRNQLIPSVTGIFPDVQLNLKNNLNRFSEANILYEQAIGLHKKKLLKQSRIRNTYSYSAFEKSGPAENHSF